MKKKYAVLQSNYIPWKGYFDIIKKVDCFVVYDIVQYTKNDWRNRNRIKSVNGLSWLTIPVCVKNLNQKILDTEIAFGKWNIKHWKSIKTNYGKSPYFNLYKDRIESLYLNCDYTNLSDINIYFINEIKSILEIETEIVKARDFDLREDRNLALIDIGKSLKASIYLSGPSAKSYLDVNLFNENDIEVEWMQYGPYKEYAQIHGEFEHNVSVLDLIFNYGPECKNYFDVPIVED